MRADLVCSFAVLKHFSLADAPLMIQNILACGNYGLIQVIVRTGDHPSIDTGEQNSYGFHHSFLNEHDLAASVSAAGHEVVRIENDIPAEEAIAGGHEWLVLTRRL